LRRSRNPTLLLTVPFAVTRDASVRLSSRRSLAHRDHHRPRAQRLAPPSTSPRKRGEVEGGSSAATYDLAVREDGSVSWTRLLTNDPQTSYQYTGPPTPTTSACGLRTTWRTLATGPRRGIRRTSTGTLIRCWCGNAITIVKTRHLWLFFGGNLRRMALAKLSN
jgi:hypothetical protein